jgi:filamin
MDPVDSRWIEIQQRTFTGWMNTHLKKRGLHVHDLIEDLQDGLLLINLLEIISAKTVAANFNKRPRVKAQKLENCGYCLKFLKEEGLKLVAIGPEDLVEPKKKLILGLIWTIILRYHIQKGGVNTSVRNELLAWVQKMIPESNVTDFTSSWHDGKAICHLVDAIERGTCDVPSVDARDDPLANAQLGEQLAEDKFGIPQILAPEDMVSPDSDELSVMTYISYYRDYWNNRSKADEMAAAKKACDPSKCLVYGPGIEGGEQFLPGTFFIQSKNKFGDDLTEGGQPFEVVVKSPKSQTIPAQVVDKGDGTYEVTYTPVDPGKHLVAVNLSGQPVAKSPYNVPIDRSSVSAFGPGLEKGVSFQPTEFTVAARRMWDNQVPVDNHDLRVDINGPKGKLPTEIQNNQDGTFTVRYEPLDPGRHAVSIFVLDKPVAETPYYVPIDKAGFNVYGPGLEKGEEHIPSEFTVEAKTFYNNKIPLTADEFKIKVQGPHGEVPTQIVDNGDGTYAVSYTPVEPGPHHINIDYRDRPVGKSPYTAGVGKGATEPSLSEAYGPGIEPTGVTLDEPARFTIQAKNKVGDNKKVGGDPFKVKVKGPYGSDPEATIVDNGDGTYAVEYEPTVPGDHVVDVTLFDQPIKDNPFNVGVDLSNDPNAADPTQFTATGPGLEGGWTTVPGEFQVQARNRKGEPIGVGGHPVNCRIDAPNGEELEGTVKDNGDGTYDVQYQAQDPGDHTVSVFVSNPKTPLFFFHIQKSPFNVPIKAGTDPSKCLCYGPGLEEAYDTLPAEFKIKARDRDGNDINQGGDPFLISVTDPEGNEVPAEIIDNGDGTYDVKYDPQTDGPHTINPTLRGKPVGGGPFKLNVKAGADHEHCVVEDFTFTIRAKTKTGEPKTTGGEKFEVAISGPDGPVEDVQVRDLLDGTYLVSYKISSPGEFTISVKINNLEIKGSPWTQKHA